MPFPPDHPLRLELNDEAHARPPEALSAPRRITFLALLSDLANREREWEHVRELARLFDVPPPRAGANHYSTDMGTFRLKWERHSEFARYKFILPGAGDDPFAEPAIATVPAGWVAGLAGQVIVAFNIAFLPGGDPPVEPETIGQRWFEGNPLVGAEVAGGAAAAFTDFRIRADGFSRLVLLDRGLAPRQAGRTLQRLMELDTYRVLALMALPLARETSPVLARLEQELSQIARSLSGASERDEPVLLDRLTRLEAEIERLAADTHFRFSAAAAYHELVLQRIAELREGRIHGLQTFREFVERRLAPAMNTCRAVWSRQESLAQRMARATQLLSTRVDVTRERQNQAVLESMNRRAKMQLRLQQTVEGLSVVAITYYLASLVGYLAKGLQAAGFAIDASLAMAVSIPVVALLVALGVGRVRRTVMRKAESSAPGPRRRPGVAVPWRAARPDVPGGTAGRGGRSASRSLTSLAT